MTSNESDVDVRRFIPFTALGIVLALAAGYWFATGGMVPARERAEWIEGSVIAHRGLHTGDSERPENSLAAFRAAMLRGFPIELDVHLSSDGEVVVFHDDTLERMTGDPRRIGEVSAEELAALRLLDSDEHIPTLREVLHLVEGDVPVLVEIKSPKGAEIGPLEKAVVAELAAYPGDVAIQSFSPFSLSAAREEDPSVPRGQLSSSFADEDLAAHEIFVLRALLMNWKSRPHFIAYEIDALPTLGTRLQQARGRPLIGWTARTPEDTARAEALCDGIIFDPGALD